MTTQIPKYVKAKALTEFVSCKTPWALGERFLDRKGVSQVRLGLRPTGYKEPWSLKSVELVPCDALVSVAAC